jgi:5-methylcytosine-specific restriction endonuclease McrBC GTP-binding regulatory subunit McrB
MELAKRNTGPFKNVGLIAARKWKQNVGKQIERIVLLDYIHRLVSQKIEELKIYTKYHNTRVHKIHTRVNY